MKFKLNEIRDSSLKLVEDTIYKTVDLGKQGVEFIKDNPGIVILGLAVLASFIPQEELDEDNRSYESFDDSYSYGEDYECSSNELDNQDIITDEEENQLSREMNDLIGQYICTECGTDFDEEDIDWSFSDEESGSYYCNICSHSLEQAGIDAMDPDGFGYDEYGNWDQEQLGL